MIESEDTMSTDEKKEREGDGDFLSQDEIDLLSDDPEFDFKFSTKEKPPAKKWAERVGSSK